MTKKQTVQLTLIGRIKSEILDVGDKLPSLRELTMDMGVSLSTALDAYNDLVSYGIIESRPKNGYFVLDTDDDLLNSTMRKLVLSALPEPVPVNNDESEIIQTKYTLKALKPFAKDCIQLMAETVSEQFFDGGAMRKQLNKSSRDIYGASEKHNFYESDAKLTQEIARWMLPLGCIFQRRFVMITGNLAEALMLAIRACAVPGEAIGIESPGDPTYFRIAHFLNMKCVEIRSDADTGLCVDDLGAQIQNGAKFSCVVLAANFSNPAGAVMPPENREALLEICGKHSIPVIEDDTRGRLSFSRETPPPLKSLDHANVIYISDFSKILGGDFNVGYIEGGKYSDRLAYIKSISGITAPFALQDGIADYMRTNGFAIRAAGIRRDMKTCVETYREVLLRALPDGVKIPMPRGGHYLWCELPNGVSARDFSNFAEERYNLLVAPGRVFSSLDGADRFFRVNCCTVKDSAIMANAAETLSRAAAQYLSLRRYDHS
jgi:DNA-binding transcriptional MocR family regulator